MWNPQHNQYTILQDNPVIYFLHADSYAALQLDPPPPSISNSSSCYVTGSSDTVGGGGGGGVAAGVAPSSGCGAAAVGAQMAASAVTSGPSSLTSEASCGSPGGFNQQQQQQHTTMSTSAALFHDAHARPTPVVIGRLLDKEFCYARKDMNRYKVQRGARFYRVKVGPTAPTVCNDPMGRCCVKRTRLDCE